MGLGTFRVVLKLLIWRYRPLPQNEGGAYIPRNRWENSPSLILGARGRGMGGLLRYQ